MAHAYAMSLFYRDEKRGCERKWLRGSLLQQEGKGGSIVDLTFLANARITTLY